MITNVLNFCTLEVKNILLKMVILEASPEWIISNVSQNASFKLKTILTKTEIIILPVVFEKRFQNWMIENDNNERRIRIICGSQWQFAQIRVSSWKNQSSNEEC